MQRIFYMPRKEIMMSVLVERLERQAALNPQRIVFPEADLDIILKAAEQLLVRKIGIPVLIGNPKTISAQAAGIGVTLDGAEFYDNTDADIRTEVMHAYTEQYDDFSEKAVLRRGKDPLQMAMFLLKSGRVDGVAAGRRLTTADVLIAAQMIVGFQEGFSTASSAGIVDAPGFEGPEGQMLAIADCAVSMQPDENALADIAIASADTVRTLLGWEPRVAMLAFSTCGSSEHASIDTIRKSIEIVKQRCPDLKIDGEFQLDTAIVEKVAASKVKHDSDVAGKANVLVFPNLHAGNIGVKLIQIFGKANVYGPVLQGFAKPVCDFSRSAPLSEMMGNIIMLIVRAQAANQKEQ
jgi:phosphate acetyltransferase